MCSQVATAERLLHETLASVGQNILCQIWVSLKKVRKSCLCASSFLHSLSLLLLCGVFVAPVPGQHGHACIAGGGGPGVGGSHPCGGTRVMAVLVAETSAQEAAAAWDSTTHHIEDAEDWATLAEGRHRRGYQEWRRRTPRHWPLLVRILKVLSERLPSLRVTLRRSAGPRSWSRRFPAACLTWPMPSIGGRCLRGSIGCNWRSSHFYRPGALNCASPLSVHHG
jgi:hypothetical protein